MFSKKRTVDRKKKNRYNEFYTNATHWAADKPVGEQIVLFDPLRKSYIAIEATEEGFIEIKSYTKKEYLKYDDKERDRREGNGFSRGSNRQGMPETRSADYGLRDRAAGGYDSGDGEISVRARDGDDRGDLQGNDASGETVLDETRFSHAFALEMEKYGFSNARIRRLLRKVPISIAKKKWQISV